MKLRTKIAFYLGNKSGPEGRVIMSNIFLKKTLNFDEDVCQESFVKGIMLF